MTERAQAELVGHVLVFSAIVLTIALVTVSGQAGLDELRDSRRTANMETGFSVLAHNVDDVVQGDAPSRATELELSGGSISLGEPVTVSVRATDPSGGSGGFTQSESLRPIVYEAPSGAKLVYVSGAIIIRGENGGTAMLREPRLLLDSDRTIVPIVNTSLGGESQRRVAGSVDGELRILVRTEQERRVPVASADQTVEVTITIESSRASAWESYFASELGSGADCIESENAISCTFVTDRATVVETRIGVSFDS